jgi:hypothetical protein|tara:strand:+ start:684 stop:2003 length:1320 start_codon:yes stop_codon:yes gene_type:complete
MNSCRVGFFQRGVVSNTGVISLVILLGAVLAAATWFGLRPKSPEALMELQAEEFVELATTLGWHRSQEVDSYIGVRSLDMRLKSSAPSMLELEASVKDLLLRVQANIEFSDSQRSRLFQEKLVRLSMLLSIINTSEVYSFKDEVAQLYELAEGEDLTQSGDESKDSNLEALDELLPGRGTLSFRVAAFRNQFIIPANKRREVFEAALAECRQRTMAHWDLPTQEKLEIQWTRDVSAAWHQYDGGFKSTLKMNDLSIGFIHTAIDVACHEGYPGHHAQFVMMEAGHGDSGFATEDSVFLTRTPASVIREGAANLGVELAFSLSQRIEFEREVLAPLAGITFPDEEKYSKFLTLIDSLAVNATPLLRDYLDGELSFNRASLRLEREALVSSPKELLRFADEFGAFSVGYEIAQRRLYKTIQGQDDKWDALLDSIVNPDTRL